MQVLPLDNLAFVIILELADRKRVPTTGCGLLAPGAIGSWSLAGASVCNLIPVDWQRYLAAATMPWQLLLLAVLQESNTTISPGGLYRLHIRVLKRGPAF